MNDELNNNFERFDNWLSTIWNINSFNDPINRRHASTSEEWTEIVLDKV